MHVAHPQATSGMSNVQYHYTNTVYVLYIWPVYLTEHRFRAPVLRLHSRTDTQRDSTRYQHTVSPISEQAKCTVHILCLYGDTVHLAGRYFLHYLGYSKSQDRWECASQVRHGTRARVRNLAKPSTAAMHRMVKHSAAIMHNIIEYTA